MSYRLVLAFRFHSTEKITVASGIRAHLPILLQLRVDVVGL